MSVALYPYQVAAKDKIVATHRTLLAMDCGCLAGDTVLSLNRGGRGFQMSIAEVVRRQGNWDANIPTQVARADNGVRRLAVMSNAWYSGVKQTYEVTTSTGRSIRATDEHPFLTPEGWSRLDALSVGDRVLVDVGRSSRGRTRKTRYHRTFGMKHHPYRTRHSKDTVWQVPTHRLVAEAVLNNMSPEAFIARVQAGGVQGLHFLDPEVYAVHHVDRDSMNNRPENLQPMTHAEHFALHSKEGTASNVLHQIGEEMITSITPYGEEDTYDIEVADDPHNFLANGFVVHNTGKTGCSLIAMEELMEQQVIQHPVLVLTLATLKYQWQDEVSKFTNSTVTVIDGTPVKRNALYAMFRNDPTDYLVVNYETFVRDYAFYRERKWGALICDESSMLSSYKSKRSKAVKALAKAIPVRVGLTGTPLENGKAEALFSQFQVIDDSLLGSFWTFEKRYITRNPKGWIVGYRNLPKLHETISPVTVRARQTDPEVAQFLPSVRQLSPRVVDWDRAGKSLYKYIARGLTDLLDEAQEMFGSGWSGFDVASIYGQGQSVFDPEEMEMRGEIMSRISALRMLCDHPDLLQHSADLFEQRITDTGEILPGAGSAYAHLLKRHGLLEPVTKSPKLIAVVDYLRDFLAINDEHKAVVFSQHRGMLDILATCLRVEYGLVQFHGGMNARDKDYVKKEFEFDSDTRLFLSSDAGGFGLNLQAANLLVNYDLPWSFGKKVQRDSRIIRAGSRWPQVSIESFIMADSLEIRQHQALDYKSSVAGAILDGGATDKHGNVLTQTQSLRDILQQILHV